MMTDVLSRDVTSTCHDGLRKKADDVPKIVERQWGGRVEGIKEIRVSS